MTPPPGILAELASLNTSGRVVRESRVLAQQLPNSTVNGLVVHIQGEIVKKKKKNERQFPLRNATLPPLGHLRQSFFIEVAVYG